MAATLHDVAALAGVSIKTVSNVVNDYKHIRPSTRERVVAAILKLDYQPNLAARSLRSGRTGVIGLALPELRLSYFAELADAVIRFAEQRGVTVLVEPTGGDRDREIARRAGAFGGLEEAGALAPTGTDGGDFRAVAPAVQSFAQGRRR